MKKEAVKAFFLACHKARRLTSSFPDLPQGVVPRDVRIIDTIGQLSCTQNSVRVSDISTSMGVTQPSVTSAIARLEKLGYVAKSHDSEDGRAVCVALTQTGYRFADLYIDRFYDWVCDQLADVAEQNLETAAYTIDAVYNAMSQVKFAHGAAPTEDEPPLPYGTEAAANATSAAGAKAGDVAC